MDRNNELSTLIKQLSSQNIADNANVDIFFKEFQTIYSGNFRLKLQSERLQRFFSGYILQYAKRQHICQVC